MWLSAMNCRPLASFAIWFDVMCDGIRVKSWMMSPKLCVCVCLIGAMGMNQIWVGKKIESNVQISRAAYESTTIWANESREHDHYFRHAFAKQIGEWLLFKEKSIKKYTYTHREREIHVQTKKKCVVQRNESPFFGISDDIRDDAVWAVMCILLPWSSLAVRWTSEHH